MPWVWDRRAQRYRDSRTGRFISRREAAELRDDWIDSQLEAANDLADQWAAGDLTTRQWNEQMRALMKRVYVNEYGLAIGGLGQVDASHYGRLGNMLREQYRQLNDLAERMHDGNYTQAQVANFSRNFLRTGRQAYKKGNAWLNGFYRGSERGALPYHPGDLTTTCKAGCKCRWDYRDGEAYWTLGRAEHCRATAGLDGCIERSRRDAPYRSQ